jgi:hypothetical protein
VEQRLAEMEQALRTSISFNLNAAAVIGRRIAYGNQALADAIAQDLKDLKHETMEGVDKGLHDHYVDTLSTMITGKA